MGCGEEEKRVQIFLNKSPLSKLKAIGREESISKNTKVNNFSKVMNCSLDVKHTVYQCSLFTSVLTLKLVIIFVVSYMLDSSKSENLVTFIWHVLKHATYFKLTHKISVSI